MLFSLPFLILWAWWFFLYPFVQSFLRSFQDVKFTALGSAKFVGLQNYVRILHDQEFYRAVLHSLEIVLIAIPVQTFLGLVMAILVNQKLNGKGIFRTVFFLSRISPRKLRSLPYS